MFLGGDPSYVQKDKELIEALDLNLKHVTAGAEPAQVARWSQLYKQEKPVLFYWYTPQYLNEEYDLAEVKLPPRTAANKDCQDDSKAGGDPEQYKCEYDRDEHPEAVQQGLCRERLTRLRGSQEHEAHQRGSGARSPRRSPATRSTPSKAGQDWVAANEKTVDSWIE